MEPRFAALSRALAAAEIISPAFSPPLLMASRAVRTAVRAAERPIVRIDVRRWVWRMRLRAERLRFLAGIGANDSRCLNISVLPMSIAAPYVVPTFVAPFHDPQQIALTVDLTRIMLLSPIFMGLSSLTTGILNSYRQFLSSATAPLVYNLVIILFTQFGYPFLGIHAVAIGVVVGALVMWLVQLPALTFPRTRYSFSPHLAHPRALDVT